MKLIVGLGNPGKEYENTRHNIGFMVLDSFVSNFLEEKKFQALIKKAKIDGEDVLFVKPLTFMNLSGNSIKKIVDYYKIELKDILVIHDDLDLPFGKYRVKTKSSSGGHNGIKSLISLLGSNAFARLKIGISHEIDYDSIDYVLGKFSKDDLYYFSKNYKTYEDIIISFVKDGIDKTMNQFNFKG